MNDEQVAKTCDLIIETYPYYKPDDFKLCFKRGILERYGKLYDRLDGAIILSWLRQYDNERTDAAINVSENECKQLEAGNVVNYEEYMRYLKEQADNGDEKAQELLSEKLDSDLLLRPDYLAYKVRRSKNTPK